MQEGRLWVTYGPAQAVKSEVVEVFAAPALHLARPEVTTFTLHAKRNEPPPHVRVELVEAFRGVPRAEVLSPSAKDWVQVGDDVADVLVTPCPGSELLHALPDSLHRAPRWPALEEVEALPLLLEQLAAQSLVQVAAEKVEALLAIVELDSSRLVRV